MNEEPDDNYDELEEHKLDEACARLREWNDDWRNPNREPFPPELLAFINRKRAARLKRLREAMKQANDELALIIWPNGRRLDSPPPPTKRSMFFWLGIVVGASLAISVGLVVSLWP